MVKLVSASALCLVLGSVAAPALADHDDGPRGPAGRDVDLVPSEAGAGSRGGDGREPRSRRSRATPGKVVFATGAGYSGDLTGEAAALDGDFKPDGSGSGLAAADRICQSHADRARLAGSYKAWLSDLSGWPAMRFTRSQRPYVRPDGRRIADDWDDLVDCEEAEARLGDCLDHPINLDENGSVVSGPAWTNTRADGVLSSPLLTCTNWSSVALPNFSLIGLPEATDIGWTAAPPSRSCFEPSSLYCFQQ